MAPAAAPSPAWGVSRSQLGRLALEAAAVVPGVVGVDAGPRESYLTADEPTGVLRGVSVIAQADGRYAVDLCLVAGIVPLIELADEVRRRVRAHAALEGLADQVGAVNVEFARVLSDEEILAEAAAEAAAAAEARPEVPNGGRPSADDGSPS